jgi:osomolarity two-component system, sensor histidine kinase SLN1
VLGDQGLGFPSALYPNLTFVPTEEADPTDNTKNLTTVYAFPDFQLNATSHLLLGPLQINSSFAIFSLTLPIINNTSAADVLGYIT